MKRTRRDVAISAAVTTLAAATPALAQPRASTPAELDAAMAPDGPPREVIQVWPRQAPGVNRRLRQHVLERSEPPALRDRAVVEVTRPTIIVFRPAQPNGAAVLMTPGGSYRRVVLDKEGFETAQRLNDAGVTAFVMFYRLPGDGHAAGADAPLQDTQRAYRLIRSRAAEFGIDPARFGIMGFSAGGHAAGSLALRFDANVYQRIDAVDDQPAKPAFAALIYPVVTLTAPYGHGESREQLVGATPTEEQINAYSLERIARGDAPPTFLCTAADDETVKVENSLLLFSALRAAGVGTELHVFEGGAHGFGIRFTVGKPTAAWPDLFLAWLKSHAMAP